MANDKLAAFEKLRPHLGLFKALTDAAEELGKVGSIEQAADEATARVDEANKRHAEIQDQITERQAALARMDQDLSFKKLEHERKIREYDTDLDQLRQKQAKVLAADADKARAELQAHLANLSATHQAALDKKTEESARLTAENERRGIEAQFKLDGILAATEKAKAEHAELNSHIAALKARFA